MVKKLDAKISTCENKREDRRIIVSEYGDKPSGSTKDEVLE